MTDSIQKQNETDRAIDNLTALIDFTQLASYSGEVIKPENLSSITMLMFEQLTIIGDNAEAPAAADADEDASPFGEAISAAASAIKDIPRQLGAVMAERVAAIAEREGKTWLQVLRGMDVDIMKFAASFGMKPSEFQASIDAANDAAKAASEDPAGAIAQGVEGVDAARLSPLRTAVGALSPLFPGYTINDVVQALVTFGGFSAEMPTVANWHDAICAAFTDFSGDVVGRMSIPEAARWITDRAHDYAARDKAA